jgi:hypothetical protein
MSSDLNRLNKLNNQLFTLQMETNNAATSMRDAAHLLPEITEHADELDGAAGIMGTWRDALDKKIESINE